MCHRVVIGKVDSSFQLIPGTEKHFAVDTICLAVGLSPMSQLLHMAGCKMQDTPLGYVPVIDENGETSIPVFMQQEMFPVLKRPALP